MRSPTGSYTSSYRAHRSEPHHHRRKEIASRLEISELTATAHIFNAYKKARRRQPRRRGGNPVHIETVAVKRLGSTMAVVITEEIAKGPLDEGVIRVLACSDPGPIPEAAYVEPLVDDDDGQLGESSHGPRRDSDELVLEASNL